MLKRWGWGGDAGRGWAASPLRSDRQQSAQQAGPAREIGLRPHLSILESKGRGVNLWASEGHRGGNMSKEIRVRKQRAGAVAPRSPREMALSDAPYSACAVAAVWGGVEAEPGGSGERREGEYGDGWHFHEASNEGKVPLQITINLVGFTQQTLSWRVRKKLKLFLNCACLHVTNSMHCLHEKIQTRPVKAGKLS